MARNEEGFAFKIDGMCCAHEVAVLKRSVGPIVGGEEKLAFDVLTGRMSVLVSPGQVPPAAVARAVATTGMHARPWPAAGSTADVSEATFWRRHGRTLLCAVSGLLLAAALAVQVSEVGGAMRAIGADAVPPAVVLLYLAATVAGAWFVAPKAVYAARSMRPDMNLLMMVAVVGAIGIGEWFEAATVSFLFAVALLLETWSVGRARRAVAALMDLSPELAAVVDADSGRTVTTPVQDVSVGAIVRIRAGDKVPLDGEILDGNTTIDQSAITGESIPVDKAAGDQVFAGTVNGAGTIDVGVTRASDETTLARIIELVEEARKQRSPSEQWVDLFARRYTPIMMALAVAVAMLPPFFLGDWGLWFYRALVLLVIACPCALVISTPVSIVAGLASGARAGVLVKGGRYLETPARLRAIAFDKTGTLTLGNPRVQRVVAFEGHTAEEVLANAAALEADSNHPIARAILASAEEAGVEFEPARSLTMVVGKGAEGIVRGRRMWIGSHRLVEEQGAESAEYRQLASRLEDEGHSLVALGDESHICGLIGIADEIRPAAKRTLEALRALGIQELVMLTGDNARTAAAVAAEVGVTDFEAELLPADKVAAVGRLQDRVGAAAMLGDGVNDAPALAAATLGIAMGAAGTDAAIETADIALMGDDLQRLPWLIRHARRTLQIIRQNILFAVAVKVVFVALAAAGLATLWMAIAADMGASLLVIANGLRLLRPHA